MAAEQAIRHPNRRNDTTGEHRRHLQDRDYKEADEDLEEMRKRRRQQREIEGATHHQWDDGERRHRHRSRSAPSSDPGDRDRRHKLSEARTRATAGSPPSHQSGEHRRRHTVHDTRPASATPSRRERVRAGDAADSSWQPRSSPPRYAERDHRHREHHRHRGSPGGRRRTAEGAPITRSGGTSASPIAPTTAPSPSVPPSPSSQEDAPATNLTDRLSQIFAEVTVPSREASPTPPASPPPPVFRVAAAPPEPVAPGSAASDASLRSLYADLSQAQQAEDRVSEDTEGDVGSFRSVSAGVTHESPAAQRPMGGHTRTSCDGSSAAASPASVDVLGVNATSSAPSKLAIHGARPNVKHIYGANVVLSDRHTAVHATRPRRMLCALGGCLVVAACTLGGIAAATMLTSSMTSTRT